MSHSVLWTQYHEWLSKDKTLNTYQVVYFPGCSYLRKKKMWIRFITFPLASRLYPCHTFSHQSLKASRTRTALLEQSLPYLFGSLFLASPLFFSPLFFFTSLSLLLSLFCRLGLSQLQPPPPLHQNSRHIKPISLIWFLFPWEKIY